MQAIKNFLKPIILFFLNLYFHSDEKSKAFARRLLRKVGNPCQKGDVKNNIEISGIDKWKELKAKNDIKISAIDKRNVSLGIQGEGNTVHIGKLAEGCTGTIDIAIAGNGCTVILEEGIGVSQYLLILVGQLHPNFGPIKNTTIHIGKSTSFENTSIITYNSNSRIEIGKECMFAYGITIFHTDAHPVYDVHTRNIINKVRTLKIGDHCWVGANATILKNVELEHDTIVGWGSIVNRKFYSNIDVTSPPSNCAIAGNPAKVVRTGVTWDSNGSNGYIQNEI